MFTDLLLSSQGTGKIKLRITSFLFAVLPILSYFGIDLPLVPEDVGRYINAILLLAFGITHVWAGYARRSLPANRSLSNTHKTPSLGVLCCLITIYVGDEVFLPQRLFLSVAPVVESFPILHQ